MSSLAFMTRWNRFVQTRELKTFLRTQIILVSFFHYPAVFYDSKLRKIRVYLKQNNKIGSMRSIPVAHQRCDSGPALPLEYV